MIPGYVFMQHTRNLTMLLAIAIIQKIGLIMRINKAQAGTFRNLIVMSCFFPPSHKNGINHLTPHKIWCRFYTECLGMKLLRKRDIPEERYTNAFLGYGPEDSHFVIELTYSMFRCSFFISPKIYHTAMYWYKLVLCADPNTVQYILVKI